MIGFRKNIVGRNKKMNLTVKKMDKELATRILKWNYEEPYDFYNNEITEEAMTELLEGSYQGLINEKGELFGFFCIGKSAQVPLGHNAGAYKEDNIDMGLGMNPMLTGKGNGYRFCAYIMSYIKEKYKDKPIRLTVATFNHRAIHLYEKLGFFKKDQFSTKLADFITMVKEN